MNEGKRTTQAEGYLALPPSGPAAQLRAGAGAKVFVPAGVSARILAVDFDRKGGAVISGIAAPGSAVGLTVDGAARGEARTQADGRFTLALDEPLSIGTHYLAANTRSSKTVAVVDTVAAAPISHAPFDARLLAGGGWRIDWMTPGGGVQTTLLLAAAPSP